MKTVASMVSSGLAVSSSQEPDIVLKLNAPDLPPTCVPSSGVPRHTNMSIYYDYRLIKCKSKLQNLSNILSIFHDWWELTLILIAFPEPMPLAPAMS